MKRKLLALCWLALSGCTRAEASNPSAKSPTASEVSRPLPASSAAAEEPCGLPPALVARGWHRRLSPTAEEPTRPTEPDSITLAVLPDTQVYVWCGEPHFKNQTNWIAGETQRRNIQAVLHLGDITEHNSAPEWRLAKEALEPVTSTLPTFLATGNHDHGDQGTADRRGTLFRQYFPSPAPPTAKTLVDTLTPGDMENAYYRLKLPKVTLGVLVLEWSPRQATVTWANDVLSKYNQDRVVFVTHAYLYHDSTRYDWTAKGQSQEWNPNEYGSSGHDVKNLDPKPPISPDAFDGEALWQALVSRHPGIFLTLNGHVLGDGTGLLSSKGVAGNVVHQVLANYQMLEEGGLGYLRLVEILPDGATLRMKTYSPSLDLWGVAADQEFELKIVPRLW